LFLIATTILVQGRDIAFFVSSKAIFTGIDDSHYDPRVNTPSDLYSDPRNHVVAAASILDTYSKQSGFDPKKYGLLSKGFSGFYFSLQGFGTSPFLWRPFPSTQISFGGDIIQLHRDIAAAYKTVDMDHTGGDVAAQLLLSQIPKTAHERFSGYWTLVLINIIGRGDYVVVEVTTLVLAVSVGADGSVSLPKQDGIRLSPTIITLDRSKLEQNAVGYGREFGWTDMDTVLDNLTTPKSKGNTPLLESWLSGSDHAFEAKSRPSMYTQDQLPQLRMGH
jgi:hypothetical protein